MLFKNELIIFVYLLNQTRFIMKSSQILFKTCFLFFLLIAFACSNEAKKAEVCTQNQVVNLNDIDFFMCQQMQFSTLTEYYRGNEKKYELKEIAMDKSEPTKITKTKVLLGSIELIEEGMNRFLKMVNELKTRVSPNSKVENPHWMIQDITKPFRTGINAISGKKLILNESILKDYEAFKAEVLVFRKVLVENAVAKSNEDKQVVFQDPNIINNLEVNEIGWILDTALEKGNVSLDDREAIRKMYIELTNLANISPSNIKSPSEFLGLLLSIENGVFSTRADAFSLIRSRIGGCGLIVDRIKVFVDSPRSCIEGEEFIVKAYIGVYSESLTPEATINQGEIDKIENGCVVYKVRANKKNEMQISGTLTTFNKSGIPISLPWKKTIKVLSK